MLTYTTISNTYHRLTQKGFQSKRLKPLCFLVRQARFERATYGLEGRCSIQLSYWRTLNLRFQHALFPTLFPTTRMNMIFLNHQRRSATIVRIIFSCNIFLQSILNIPSLTRSVVGAADQSCSFNLNNDPHPPWTTSPLTSKYLSHTLPSQQCL